MYKIETGVAPSVPTTGERPKMIADRETVMADPNLLFASFTDSGLCGGPNGEGGSCSFNGYLYYSGEYVKESSFLSYEHEITYSSSSEKLSAEKINMIIDFIRQSEILEKKCEPQLIMDTWFSYFINLDGKKRKFDYSPPQECETIFEQIKNLIEKDI